MPLTTVEWEGKLAAVVFAQGCPWRCRYCHNTSLVPKTGTLIPWEEVLAFLKDRVGLIDSVVFSGGEPTAQASLPAAVQAVGDLRFQIAVHTNGGNPRVLAEILEWDYVRYVALDVKGPFSRYHEITRVRGSGKKVQQSIGAVIRAAESRGLGYEFRTTYHSDLLSDDEVLEMARDLQWRGATSYFVQKYRHEGTGDMPLALTPSRDLSPRVVAELEQMFARFGVRG